MASKTISLITLAFCFICLPLGVKSWWGRADYCDGRDYNLRQGWAVRLTPSKWNLVDNALRIKIDEPVELAFLFYPVFTYNDAKVVISIGYDDMLEIGPSSNNSFSPALSTTDPVYFRQKLDLKDMTIGEQDFKIEVINLESQGDGDKLAFCLVFPVDLIRGDLEMYSAQR